MTKQQLKKARQVFWCGLDDEEKEFFRQLNKRMGPCKFGEYETGGVVPLVPVRIEWGSD
jgi:hypothetical protein